MVLFGDARAHFSYRENERDAVRFRARAGGGGVCSPQHGAGARKGGRLPGLWTGWEAEPIFAFHERSAGSGLRQSS
jgi:hypothetical protein